MVSTIPRPLLPAQPDRFELHFTPLRREGRDVCIPCDAAGHVDLDALDERVRNDYYYARAMLGREFALPCVEAPRRERYAKQPRGA
jgi:hypothetical protein